MRTKPPTSVSKWHKCEGYSTGSALWHQLYLIIHIYIQ